jgi:hypothetical protein
MVVPLDNANVTEEPFGDNAAWHAPKGGIVPATLVGVNVSRRKRFAAHPIRYTKRRSAHIETKRYGAGNGWKLKSRKSERCYDCVLRDPNL